MVSRKKKKHATKTPSQKAMDDGKKLPKQSKVPLTQGESRTPAPSNTRRRSKSRDRTGAIQDGTIRVTTQRSPTRSSSRDGRSPPRRNYLRNDKNNNNNNSTYSTSEHSNSPKRNLTPRMTGGNIMRAPPKPKLTLPKNWTTRSGRFRPSESGWGFNDARSTFGMLTAGLSVVSSGLSGFGASTSSQQQHQPTSQSSPPRRKLKSGKDIINDEIVDPEQQAKFYADLEQKGINQVIVVDAEWETRSTVSVVSLSEASYILDLAQQKQYRQKERQEEALEEAFILYKAALAEGAVDDEEMFFMFLEEIKKELDEKYAEKDDKMDRLLDEALEGEIERREKEKQRKLEKGSLHSNDSRSTENGSQLKHAIPDEEYYTEVAQGDVPDEEGGDKLDDDVEVKPQISVKTRQSKTNNSQKIKAVASNNPLDNLKQSPGFFACCGKDVEDAVVTSKPSMGELVSKSLQQRDPAFFQKLRRQQEEEKRKLQQVKLTSEDEWWQKNDVVVNVPEVKDDMPSKSFTWKSVESSNPGSDRSPRRRKSWMTKSSDGERSPRRSSRSTDGSSFVSTGTSEANPSSCSEASIRGRSSKNKPQQRRRSDPTLETFDEPLLKRTLSAGPVSPGSKKSKRSPRKAKSSMDLSGNGKGDGSTLSSDKTKSKKKGKPLIGMEGIGAKSTIKQKKSKSRLADSSPSKSLKKKASPPNRELSMTYASDTEGTAKMNKTSKSRDKKDLGNGNIKPKQKKPSS